MLVTIGILQSLHVLLVIGAPGKHDHESQFRCFDHSCHHDEICLITLHKDHMQANCHPDHDPHGPPHPQPHLERIRLCSESLVDGQNHDNGFECFCNNEECTKQVLNYVYGHTNPPPDKDFVCDTYACNSNEICRINNVGGAIRGQCMDDPGQHGIIVRFGCPVFLRAGQECYCNNKQCVNDARAVTTTSTTTTTTASPPSGVPTFHPLCVDHDTRCALFKDSLCHATTQAYAIATCARTCNLCDQYIASLHLPTPALTAQQTTSTTNTPTTAATTTKPTTAATTTKPTTAATTTKPTIAATTTKPTTTPMPTTSAASLTTNTVPAKCNTCGDIDNYIPCFSRDVFSNQTSVCPAGHNFCMTDIFTDADGNADLFKRCVTEQTCNTKWTNDSAKFDYCRQYGVVANDDAYECHFCCTGDGCNTSIKPSDSTLVVPHAFLIVGK